MSSSDSTVYFVIPLSVQKEDEIYLVGSADLQEFYQFPEQGLYILNMLREGSTPASIKSSLQRESSELIDVDDFIETLKQIEFICPMKDKIEHQKKVETVSSEDKRISFKINQKFANILFSPVAFFCYLSIICYTLFCMTGNVELRPNVHAFYFENNITISMLLVQILFLIVVSMHELGHMFASARRGISTRFSVGNRLWYIVVEADITGIFALPKNQRYFPLLAGMMVDVFNIAALTIFIKLIIAYGMSRYVEHVIQALIMQIIFNLLWQFNIFVKTDIYYVVCNYLSHPDLDKEARVYLRGVLYIFSRGRLGAPALSPFRGNMTTLSAFVAIWLFGRVVSISLLLTVFIPTVYHYLVQAYQLYQDPAVGIGSAFDLALAIIIGLSIVTTGMYMWLKQHKYADQTA